MHETKRIVAQAHPKYVIWENVKGALSKKNKHNFEQYISDMSNLGYTTYYQVLNSKDYGTPQSRERIFAVSIRKDIDAGYEFPKPIPLTKVLQDVLDENVDEKYYVKQELADKIINSLKEKIVSNTVRVGGEAHSIGTLGTWFSQGVLVRKCCTQLNRTINIAPTIMARDYKGFGNQDMLAIVEVKK